MPERLTGSTAKAAAEVARYLQSESRSKGLCWEQDTTFAMLAGVTAVYVPAKQKIFITSRPQ